MSVTLLSSAEPLLHHTALWRYMKFSTFMLLLEGAAFFPSVSTLRSGDPLEGELVPEPEWLIGKLHEMCGKKINLLDAWLEANANPAQKSFLKLNRGDGFLRTQILADVFVRELAKRRAVWCWFQAEHESAAMWSIYANAGIAVKTYLEDLRESLPTNSDFQVAKIKYVHREATSSPSYFNPEAGKNQEIIQRPYLIKGIEYQHEKEVRVTTTSLPDEKGRLVSGIAVARLVKEVVISPLLPLEETDAIESVVKKHRWDATAPSIRRSSILGRIAEREDNTVQISKIVTEDLQFKEPDLPFPLNEI